MGGHGDQEFLVSNTKSRDFLIFVILAIFSIALSVTTSQMGIIGGVALFAFLLSIFIVGFTLIKPIVGYYVLYIYTFFMFYIENLVTLPVPVGVFVDVLLWLVFISVLLTRRSSNLNKLTSDDSLSSSFIWYVIIFTVLHDFAQIFNPLSPFGINHTLLEFRESIYLILVFFITYRIFDTRKLVYNYTSVLLLLSLIVALYGLFQEFFGLREFEWAWLRSDPRRFELYYIWGSVRKWSVLSDPSVFGMLMAFSGIVCFVIAIGYGKLWFKVGMFILAIVFLLAMSFSGTRTAYGMVPLGIVMYFFVTLNNIKTLIISLVTTFLFLVIIFGPFYGPTLNRIRSTFNRNDPSMSFRDYKRDILQDYVFSHPLGTGLGSANNVAKRLTVTADTDNGYLRTAVDKGFLGLILQLCLYATVMIVGIRKFYLLDEKDKVLCAAFLSGLFALTFANFYQDVADQKPLNLILASIFALILRFRKT